MTITGSLEYDTFLEELLSVSVNCLDAELALFAMLMFRVFYDYP